MPRNRNGKQPRRLGPDTVDIEAILNAIYDDHGVPAAVHAYIALDGRLFVEAEADVYVSGRPLLHVSMGRFVGGNGPDFMSACMQSLHAVYHEIDRIEARRRAGGG